MITGRFVLLALLGTLPLLWFPSLSTALAWLGILVLGLLFDLTSRAESEPPASAQGQAG